MPRITFQNPLGPKSEGPISLDVAPGTSILDAAEECHARVGHACGGNLACSTCHVWVHEGLDSLPEVTDKENDIMDKAFDVRAESPRAYSKPWSLQKRTAPPCIRVWPSVRPRRPRLQ